MVAKKSGGGTKELDIQGICEAINKMDGCGGTTRDALTWFGSGRITSVERFGSGCPALDVALGGGYPVGRMIEFFGPESGGKSTLCYHAMAEFQKQYPDAKLAIIDAEHSIDPDYVRTIGVNTDQVILNQPETGEQALNVMAQLVQFGIKLIVVDSVAALVPESESGAWGKQTVGTQARMLTPALRQLAGLCWHARCTIFFTNQLREKIGVMFGSPETTPGGRALKHYCSVRVDVRQVGEKAKDQDGTIIASQVKALVRKNKTAPPYRIARFQVTFGIGIDQVPAVWDSAAEMGIVDQRGSWFSYQEEQVGQGRDKCIDALRHDQELFASIQADVEQAIRDALSNADTVPDAPPVEGEPEVIDVDLLEGGDDADVQYGVGSASDKGAEDGG